MSAREIVRHPEPGQSTVCMVLSSVRTSFQDWPSGVRAHWSISAQSLFDASILSDLLFVSLSLSSACLLKVSSTRCFSFRSRSATSWALSGIFTGGAGAATCCGRGGGPPLGYPEGPPMPQSMRSSGKEATLALAGGGGWAGANLAAAGFPGDAVSIMSTGRLAEGGGGDLLGDSGLLRGGEGDDVGDRSGEGLAPPPPLASWWRGGPSGGKSSNLSSAPPKREACWAPAKLLPGTGSWERTAAPSGTRSAFMEMCPLKKGTCCASLARST
mmetsp:Transcript_119940/g.340001  ORF Transcript_119940/g.340001 Transcript_119940/m.340001 type:complete len:271 (+) Transcript_119940:267-1079(+)